MATPSSAMRNHSPVPAPTQQAAPAPAPHRRSSIPVPPARGTPFVLAAPPAVRLATSPAGAARSGLPPEVAQLVREPGAGSPLSAEMRRTLESSLEVPLYPVRVHTDARAAAVVDHLGARAFTYGL